MLQETSLGIGQTAVEFQANGERLDGVLQFPDMRLAPFPAVVVCHPHPLFGGAMDSPVVRAICASLARTGIASLRFNFRYNGPDAEKLADSAREDIMAAWALTQSWDPVRRGLCGLAGYSFGASVIAKSWPDLDGARAAALVAPTVNSVRNSSLRSDTRPRLFLVGSRDKLVDPAGLQAEVEDMASGATFEILEGADHSLGLYEEAVGERVARFMGHALQA